MDLLEGFRSYRYLKLGNAFSPNFQRILTAKLYIGREHVLEMQE